MAFNHRQQTLDHCQPQMEAAFSLAERRSRLDCVRERHRGQPRGRVLHARHGGITHMIDTIVFKWDDARLLSQEPHGLSTIAF